jgi:hypothetical protein
MSEPPLPTKQGNFGLSIFDPGFQFLVRCRHCDACAEVTVVTGRPGWSIRLTCSTCGKSKQSGVRVIYEGRPIDPYFQLPLWLQRPCCGKTLWAYNLGHVAFLEAYLGASQRSRRLAWNLRIRAGGMRPGHLPQWMKAAKNREEVLRGIASLREMALASD